MVSDTPYSILTDNNNYKVLPVAKDYNACVEINTGLAPYRWKMGAIFPVSFTDMKVFMARVDDVLSVYRRGLKAEHIDYKVSSSWCNVLKNNCVDRTTIARMGDPEHEGRSYFFSNGWLIFQR